MAGVCAGVKRAAAAAGESVVRVLQLPELVPWAGAAQMQRKLVDVHREDKQFCRNKMTFVEGGGREGGYFVLWCVGRMWHFLFWFGAALRSFPRVWLVRFGVCGRALVGQARTVPAPTNIHGRKKDRHQQGAARPSARARRRCS